MRVLYLEGDDCSPKYVAGAMGAAGIEVVREAPPGNKLDDVDAVLLSDVPRDDLGRELEAALVAFHRDGGGIVMVGGWTSMGHGGYADSPLAPLLGVHLSDGDDRVNVPSGLVLGPTAHPLVAELGFDPPPIITGLNAVRPRVGALIALQAWAVQGREGETLRLEPEPRPVLVLQEGRDGRGAAVATDLAPHWSGGWTDWGTRRIDVGHGEELGDRYVSFIGRLLEWAAGAK